MNTYYVTKKWLIGGLDDAPRSRLLLGPRSVGKSTLLLECAEQLGDRAIYVTGDDPAMLLPDAWDRVWSEAGRARPERPVVLLDEAHLWPRWRERIEEAAGRLAAEGRPAHVVAAASAVRLAPPGTRGRAAAQPMETATLAHWSASSVAATFEVDPADAADALVAFGGYPGAFEFMTNRARWAAYVRDTVINPALDRDLPALAPIRQPALLRQVFAAAVLHPCEVLSLQHIQARLLDRGSLTTIALYLRLLGDAGLVAPLPRFSPRRARQRAAPPRLVVLDNAIISALHPRGAPDRAREPERHNTWVANACLAHAVNAGQRVSYWREEPFEVDAVIDGEWGQWAVLVRTSPRSARDHLGLDEFVSRYSGYRPLVITADTWRQFLVSGPPREPRAGGPEPSRH